MQIETERPEKSERRFEQVEHPKGMLGPLTGWTMRCLNAGMNQAAVEVLAPQPNDRILEIGFGPGDAIARLARQINTGLIAGVDHSQTMVVQASRRNAHSIDRGLVKLHHGIIWNIPYPNTTFDRVFAVNSFQFWTQPERDLEKIFYLLKPGGRLLIVIRVQDAHSQLDFAGAGLGATVVERAVQAATAVNFENVRTQRRSAYPFPAVCVEAHKPK